MIAWVLRFGLFAYGNPGDGLWMIILSCVVYGMAFDFFNISGSLFVETSTDSKIRSSAQGLFMMMTNGFGAVLGSVVSGQIISLPVVEGQRVKKGQLIAAIDPRDISLQYAADKAAYETAAAQVERNKRLLGRQAISVQEYEISVANYQKAKSTYELSGNNMRDTRLTAPFEGSIEKRLVENYQRVNAGEGVVQLVNTQKLRIKFTVPDDYLYLLRAKVVKFMVVFDCYPAEAFDA